MAGEHRGMGHTLPLRLRLPLSWGPPIEAAQAWLGDMAQGEPPLLAQAAAEASVESD